LNFVALDSQLYLNELKLVWPAEESRAELAKMLIMLSQNKCMCQCVIKINASSDLFLAQVLNEEYFFVRNYNKKKHKWFDKLYLKKCSA
jgi:hypothetical protein